MHGSARTNSIPFHFLLALAGSAVLTGGGCRNGKDPSSEPKPAPTAEPAALEAPVGEAAASDSAPILAEEPNRWAYAERVVEGAKGGWVTADFDEKRNKIEVRTENIEEFSLDTSRIPINWQRLVILGIDGSNSELRRRNVDVIHFRRDAHKRWVVVEP